MARTIRTIRPITTEDQAFVTEMQYEALFVPPDAEAYPRAVLDEPAIARSHAGFGTRAGDRALLAGVPVCGLSVDDRNPARRLYDRFGFRQVRCDGEHTVVMVRGVAT